MFTLEIEGWPVAVLNLPTAADAEELLGEKEFRKDLTTLEYEGRPLWDGQALLSLREATSDERAEFEGSLADEEGASEDDDEGGFVMFLVDAPSPRTRATWVIKYRTVRSR
jgi:hypothetical protein